MANITDDWLYVCKKARVEIFVKRFTRFNPRRIVWTNDVRQAQNMTEGGWNAVFDADRDSETSVIRCVKEHNLCLVSYDL